MRSRGGVGGEDGYDLGRFAHSVSLRKKLSRGAGNCGHGTEERGETGGICPWVGLPRQRIWTAPLPRAATATCWRALRWAAGTGRRRPAPPRNRAGQWLPCLAPSGSGEGAGPRCCGVDRCGPGWTISPSKMVVCEEIVGWFYVGKGVPVC
jgi:hypothetical protein